MRNEVRREKLVEVLRMNETASIEELAGILGVSRMTVHRAPDYLVEHNVVRKTRGGATMLPTARYEADYDYRARTDLEEKRALGRAAAELVEPGMAVILDDSSTVGQVVPHLADKKPLTIVTTALGIVQT